MYTKKKSIKCKGIYEIRASCKGLMLLTCFSAFSRFILKYNDSFNFLLTLYLLLLMFTRSAGLLRTYCLVFKYRNIRITWKCLKEGHNE